MDKFCKQKAVKVGLFAPRYNLDKNNLLVRVAPIDGFIQRVAPEELRRHKLQPSYYQGLAGHSGERRRYNTLIRDLHKPMMGYNTYSLVQWVLQKSNATQIPAKIEVISSIGPPRTHRYRHSRYITEDQAWKPLCHCHDGSSQYSDKSNVLFWNISDANAEAVHRSSDYFLRSIRLLTERQRATVRW